MSNHDPQRVIGDISILYEISLAVGRSLDLRTNCEGFLQVLLARKNLAYGGVWIRTSLLSLPTAENGTPGEDGFSLVYGAPMFRIRERTIAHSHPLVQRLERTPIFSEAAGTAVFDELVTENRIRGGAYALFDLAGIGFLKLYSGMRRTAFRPEELNQLRNAVSKFAVSIEGCLAHQGLLWEIAERTQAQASLRASEERYRNVVEHASDGIIVIQDGLVVFTNGRAAAMAGTSPSAMRGASFIQFVHPAERQRVLDIYKRRLAGDVLPSVYETHLVNADGKSFTVEITASLISYDGKPATLVLFRDITERRRVEAERARLALALEQTADAVLISDTQNRIQYVNTAFEAITGYSRSELLGRDPSLLKSELEDADSFRTMRAELDAGRAWHGRLQSRRKDGKLVMCDTIVTPTRDEFGQVVGYISVQRDITRELQMEEQYLQSQKMESIGRLAGGIAHDFNNIMTAVLGFGTMILDQVGNNHSLRHAVEQIVSAGERATNLTRQLLTFSRKQMVEVRNLDLNAVIVEMFNLLRRALGEDVELVTQLDDDAGCIQADAGLIQQVVMNLSINARDAMPRGGTLTIRTEVVRQASKTGTSEIVLPPGDYILLSVSDTGHGMSPQVLAHVFEPFYTTKPKGKGTGLGLATVYGIVQQCGGRIKIDSAVGTGTTVRIWLPRLTTTSDAIPVEIEDHAERGTETILVVEDEDLVRDLTVRILHSLGYNVLEAANGKEGLALFNQKHGRVDLVLTDVVMPCMGGPEMAENLLQINPSLKVLYTSGFTEIAVQERGVPVGKRRLIQKPYTRELLAKRIRDMLSESRHA